MSNLSFTAETMQELLDFLKKISGNDLSLKRDIIRGKISNFCEENGISDIYEMMDKTMKNRILRQNLINLITINETYFMREVRQLESVVYYANSLDYTSVSILCAPCSSGEEVYSLGIIAKTIGIDRFKLKIVGIDINSEVIEKCELGEYSQRSLQNVNSAQKATFFDEIGDKFKIKKNLMPRLEFKVANLFDDNIFKLGTFDIILSRNMLIYFDEYHRAISLDRFHKLLKPEGRLYVGNADIIPSSEIFDKIIDLSAIYYQKVNFN